MPTRRFKDQVHPKDFHERYSSNNAKRVNRKLGWQAKAWEGCHKFFHQLLLALLTATQEHTKGKKNEFGRSFPWSIMISLQATSSCGLPLLVLVLFAKLSASDSPCVPPLPPNIQVGGIPPTLHSAIIFQTLAISLLHLPIVALAPSSIPLAPYAKSSCSPPHSTPSFLFHHVFLHETTLLLQELWPPLPKC